MRPRSIALGIVIAFFAALPLQAGEAKIKSEKKIVYGKGDDVDLEARSMLRRRQADTNQKGGEIHEFHENRGRRFLLSLLIIARLQMTRVRRELRDVLAADQAGLRHRSP